MLRVELDKAKDPDSGRTDKEIKKAERDKKIAEISMMSFGIPAAALLVLFIVYTAYYGFIVPANRREERVV
jgi:hypothetical protein